MVNGLKVVQRLQLNVYRLIYCSSNGKREFTAFFATSIASVYTGSRREDAVLALRNSYFDFWNLVESALDAQAGKMLCHGKSKVILRIYV